MLFIVLDILAKNKKFGVLIQSFDLFHKVFVLCFIKCFNVIEILKGDRNGDGCVRSTSLTHHLHGFMIHTNQIPLARLYDIVEKFPNFCGLISTPFLLSKTGPPSKGVLLGLLCNYIKF